MIACNEVIVTSLAVSSSCHVLVLLIHPSIGLFTINSSVKMMSARHLVKLVPRAVTCGPARLKHSLPDLPYDYGGNPEDQFCLKRLV